MTLWGHGGELGFPWERRASQQTAPQGQRVPSHPVSPLPAAQPRDAAGGTATPHGARPLPKRGSGDVCASAAPGRIWAGLVSQPGAGGSVPCCPQLLAPSQGAAVALWAQPMRWDPRDPSGATVAHPTDTKPESSRGQRRRWLRHPLRKGRRCHKHAASQRSRVETWPGISSRLSLSRPGLQRGRSPPGRRGHRPG